MAKNTQFLRTDEEIIGKCERLYDEMGQSKEYLSAINGLTKQICQEKQAIWEQIIEGLKHTIQGDGLEIPASFAHTKHYIKAYEIFTSVVKKIKDKESLLYIYVEKERITALALSRTKDINTVIKLFDKNIINKFKKSKNIKILAQAVSAMLRKSFVLWEVNKKNITDNVLLSVKNIQDELIKTFSSKKNPEIQVIVAKCLRNKANTIGKEIERNETKGIEIRNKVIEQYKKSKDDLLKIQVAKEMLNKASFLSELNATEEIKKKHELYRDSKNYEKEILDTYSELIDNFKDSDNIIIQENVAVAMELKGEFFYNKGQKNKALLIYDELINKFRNNKRDIIKYIISNALSFKGEILVHQVYQNPEQKKEIFKQSIETYTELINTLEEVDKTAWNYREIQKYVAFAKGCKANILFEQEEYVAALDLFTELVNRYSKYKDADLRFSAMKKMAEALIKQTNISKNEELVKQAIEIRTKLLDLYKNDNNLERQEDIAEIMMKRALNKFFIKNYHEAIDGFQEVIDKYNTEKYQQHWKFREIVNDAISEKRKIENTLPIFEILEFNPTNEDNINDLINSIAKGSVIPVIGAGLSQFSYPLWKKFLLSVFDKHKEHIKDINREDFVKNNCKKQASILMENLTSSIFKNEVKSHFSDKNETKEILEKQPVWFLPVLFRGEIIITTNFDNLIKRVFALHGNIEFEQCTPKEIQKIENKRKSTTLLYKIHGTVEAFDSAILTEEEFYETYKKGSPAYNGMVKTLKNAEKILFLGCSLEERHEILSFCNGKDDSTAIYAICPCEDDDNKKMEIIKRLGNNGINMPILYPSKNNHAYLYTLLYYIAYCIHDRPA
jgi:tetratricopeptide (TPR) repeat protein